MLMRLAVRIDANQVREATPALVYASGECGMSPGLPHAENAASRDGTPTHFFSTTGSNWLIV